MAILNKIRQRSLFLILIIALALFSFVLADLFKNSDALTSKSQNIVATINDKDITREAFLQKVETAQKRAGTSATNTQIMNRVWEQEVRQAVMETQFKELGISVEKDQMKDLLKTALATNPEFQNQAGLFDQAKLNEYIANLKETSQIGFQSWINYEKQIAANALEQSYFNLVKAGLTTTLAEGELDHKLESNKVDIKFVQLAYSSIPDSLVKVSKSDVSNYINKNKKQYQVQASRDIKYVAFNEIATLEDENAIKTELETYLNGGIIKAKGRKDTIIAFSKIKNDEDYINTIAESDIKFNNRFIFKSALPTAVSDSIYNLKKGDVFGPYKDAGHFKISKVVAVKQIPDSAKVRHILIPFLGSTSATTKTTQTQAQAKKTADSLVKVLKSNRFKFPELVKEFSSDQGSLEKQGRYDWHPYNTMVPEFNDFEFERKVGDIGVVKTAFGFHVIEIEGQKNKKKAIQVGTIGKKIEPSQATIDKVFRDASSFEITVANEDFQQTATQEKLSLRPVNGIKVLDENIPGVGSQRPIVRWTFQADAKVGDVKRFNIPNGYVIAQLVAKHKQGLMPVDDARVKVSPMIKKEKKAQMIRQKISATTLDDLANAQNTSVKSASAINMKNPTISGAGKEPLVVGAAFGLNEGETSKLIDGTNGVYMIQVTKVTPAVELDNYQSAANRVEQQKSSTVNTKLYRALKETADIQDNRVSSQVQ